MSVRCAQILQVGLDSKHTDRLRKHHETPLVTVIRVTRVSGFYKILSIHMDVHASESGSIRCGSKVYKFRSNKFVQCL